MKGDPRYEFATVFIPLAIITTAYFIFGKHGAPLRHIAIGAFLGWGASVAWNIVVRRHKELKKHP